MKINKGSKSNSPLYLALFWFIAVGYFQSINQSSSQIIEEKDYVEFKGIVVSEDSNSLLEFANISVNETNITIVANADGEFLLKVPKSDLDKSVTFAYLGYKNKVIQLSNFSPTNNKIVLVESVTNLPEINVISKDPDALIGELMKSRRTNSIDKPIIMKGFYRESIKKRRTYASLSEAVVVVYKKPFVSRSKSYVKLEKLRKSTNYKKIDTLVIKLQGGPYNTLNIDMIENNDLFFNDDIFEYYKFTFDKTISIDDRITYVVRFEPNGYVSIPLFYGKLYIDAETSALSKAFFSLNLDDQKKASKYFVKKKPAKADVLPFRADYRVEYKINNGHWFYNYSRIELSFKIDWTKKIFNSIYHITIEKAITDWKINDKNENLKFRERLRSNVILNDEASGFSDSDFWGEYNVIEPDKSIENAIKKIKRHLNRS